MADHPQLWVASGQEEIPQHTARQVVLPLSPNDAAEMAEHESLNGRANAAQGLWQLQKETNRISAKVP